MGELVELLARPINNPAQKDRSILGLPILQYLDADVSATSRAELELATRTPPKNHPRVNREPQPCYSFSIVQWLHHEF